MLITEELVLRNRVKQSSTTSVPRRILAPNQTHEAPAAVYVETAKRGICEPCSLSHLTGGTGTITLKNA